MGICNPFEYQTGTGFHFEWEHGSLILFFVIPLLTVGIVLMTIFIQGCMFFWKNELCGTLEVILFPQ